MSALSKIFSSKLSLFPSCSTFFSVLLKNSQGKVITVLVPSVRFDKVIRKGLNISQHDFEKSFYHGAFYLNSEKLTKKSHKLEENDILDLVIQKEEGKKYGKRVILMSISEKEKGSLVTLRCIRCVHQLSDDSDAH